MSARSGAKRLLVLGAAFAALLAAGAAARELDALLEDLGSPQEELRLEAGRALIPLLEERYVEALPRLAELARSPDPALQEIGIALLAMGALVSLENATAAARAEDAFVAALSADSAKVRRNAVLGLGLTMPATPSSAAPALLAVLAGDPDESVRTKASDALGRLSAPGPAVRAALLDALQSGDTPSIRGAAARALARLGMGDRAVVDALIAATRSDDAFLRQESIGALAELGASAASAVGALEELAASDPEPLNRELARSALKRIERSAPDGH